MKGIILAGAPATRPYPITQGVSEATAAGLRQADDLLPAVTLVMAGIRDVLVISTAWDALTFGGCSATDRMFGISIYLRDPGPARRPSRRPSSWR